MEAGHSAHNASSTDARQCGGPHSPPAKRPTKRPGTQAHGSIRFHFCHVMEKISAEQTHDRPLSKHSKNYRRICSHQDGTEKKRASPRTRQGMHTKTGFSNIGIDRKYHQRCEESWWMSAAGLQSFLAGCRRPCFANPFVYFMGSGRVASDGPEKVRLAAPSRVERKGHGE